MFKENEKENLDIPRSAELRAEKVFSIWKKKRRRRKKAGGGTLLLAALIGNILDGFRGL